MALSRISAHLDTDRTSNIYEIYVRELLLHIRDLGVVNCSSNNAFEGADGVAEVGGFEGFCSLADGALLEAEGNKRSTLEVSSSSWVSRHSIKWGNGDDASAWNVYLSESLVRPYTI